MSNKKWIIIFGVVVVIIFITFVIGISKNDVLYSSTTESEKIQDEYESLNGKLSVDNKEYPKVDIANNNIKYTNIDKVLELLYGGDGDAVVYIGYAECVYCRNAIQVLVDTAKKSDLEEVYYLDISDVWDIRVIDDDGSVKVVKEADPKYYTLLDELLAEYIEDDIPEDYMVEDYILKDKDGNDVNTGVKRLKVPTVLFIVNGEVASSNVGTLFSQEDPYVELDKDQVFGLSEIYSYGIRDVISGLNDG